MAPVDVRSPASDPPSRSYEETSLLASPFGSAMRASPFGSAAWMRRMLGAGSRAIRATPREAARAALRAAAENLYREGAVVFASLEGWPRPPAIHGFVPDLYALFEDREVLLELDAGAIPEGDDSARRRDLAFAAWADAAPGREYLRIKAA